MKTAEEAEAIFRKQYKEVMAKAEIATDKENEENKEYHEKANSVCPNCKSDNVNDRIKRIQGEGSMSGSMSSSLLGGYGSMSGSSSFDTNEVNKCNDCSHEWKKHERSYTSVKEVIDSAVGILTYRHKMITDRSGFMFNADDWNCKYSSQEEADKAFGEHIKDAFKHYTSKDILYGIHPEVVKKLIENYGSDWDMSRFVNISDSAWERYGNPILDYNKPIVTKNKLAAITGSALGIALSVLVSAGFLALLFFGFIKPFMMPL